MTDRSSVSPRLPRVLVVARQGSNTEILRLLLESYAFVDVISPELLGEPMPHDVALVDLDTCGVDAVRVIRGRGVPAMVYGQGRDAHVVAEAIRSGARAFIARPIDADHLRAKVRAVYRRTRAA